MDFGGGLNRSVNNSWRSPAKTMPRLASHWMKARPGRVKIDVLTPDAQVGF
jgi:hypothetical protein